MNIDYFKKDIDELIGDFSQDESTTLADMKIVWLSKIFSYIHEACPSTNLAFFLQSLYAHCIGYILDHTDWVAFIAFTVFMRLGHSNLLLRELKNLRILVVDAKANEIKVVPALVKRMMERNMFLFGSVDLTESSVTETVNHLQQLQNACIQVAYEKLFDSTKIENYVHMDLGMEVDLNFLKKMSVEYAEAKNAAIKEASSILDVQNIKHISEDKELIGDVVEKIADDWLDQKQTFYKQTGLGEDEVYGQELEQLLLLQQHSDDEEYKAD